ELLDDREDLGRCVADRGDRAALDASVLEIDPRLAQELVLAKLLRLGRRNEPRTDRLRLDHVHDGHDGMPPRKVSRVAQRPSRRRRAVVGDDDRLLRANLRLAHGRWYGTLESTTRGSKRSSRLR